MNATPRIRAIALILLILVAATAHAYVGPGLGVGLIGALIGGIVAVFLAIAGVVWYPVKRLLKKKRAAASGADDTALDAPEDDREDEIEQRNET